MIAFQIAEFSLQKGDTGTRATEWSRELLDTPAPWGVCVPADAFGVRAPCPLHGLLDKQKTHKFSPRAPAGEPQTSGTKQGGL